MSRVRTIIEGRRRSRIDVLTELRAMADDDPITADDRQCGHLYVCWPRRRQPARRSWSPRAWSPRRTPDPPRRDDALRVSVSVSGAAGPPARAMARSMVGYWTASRVPFLSRRVSSRHPLDGLGGGAGARRALSSQTPTSRSRSAPAGRQVRAHGSPPGADHAASGTQIAPRPRSRLRARQPVLP
jgi:hypothetical protein